MRKHHLIPMACLLLSACATDDVGNKTSTTTPAKSTPVKKPPSNVPQSTKPPVKVRPTLPASASAPLEGTVIQHRNRGKAQLLNAVGGALEPANAEAYMAQQLEDLRRALQNEIDQGDMQIEKRNSDDVIRISMTPPNGFDNLSSVVKPDFLASLSKIFPVLNQYGKTLVTVIGYIETAGPDAGNLKLAERRAKSVADYFIIQNVDALRLQSFARGDAASGNPVQNPQPLRRIELWIQPVVTQ